MYHTCIFCAKDLGTNESLEHFPVGSRVAFDSFKGRLWAVCPRCTRWNLAPIEERWEAVEEAERIFHDSRMRVQSENIGMAKLRDGTRLIRIGSALPGELAAWRYGTQLVKRRTNHYLAIGGIAAASGAVFFGLPAILAVGAPVGLINPAIQLTNLVYQRRAFERVVLQLPSHESPTNTALTIRRRHLLEAKLTNENGEMALVLPEPVAKAPFVLRRAAIPHTGELITLRGQHAQRVAARAMVDYNANGASKKSVTEALDLLTRAGTAHDFIQQVTQKNIGLMRVPREYNRRRGKIVTPRQVLGTFRGERLELEKYTDIIPAPGIPLPRTEALALEMAMHDESERRAMEGELELLEDAWREAEEIAHIADALPGEPE